MPAVGRPWPSDDDDDALIDIDDDSNNSQVTVLHAPIVSLDQSYQHGPKGATLELVCTVKVK